MRFRFLTAALVALSLPATVRAQGEIRGRVTAGDERTPVAGAELRLLGLTMSATTDSTGRFVLAGIPRGDHLLVVRAVGFGADTSDVQFSSNETLFKDVTLRRSTTVLDPVNVRAREARVEAPWRGDFLRRKEAGIGRQIDRDVLARFDNRTLIDVLVANATGVEIRRGTGSKAWAATGRAVNSAGCAFCRVRKEEVLDGGDIAAGAQPACYMDVYLDGVAVYTAAAALAGAGSPTGGRTVFSAPPLFDLNSLRPEQIESVEIYASAAQVPAQYNRTSSGCGVMLIWLRR